MMWGILFEKQQTGYQNMLNTRSVAGPLLNITLLPEPEPLAQPLFLLQEQPFLLPVQLQAQAPRPSVRVLVLLSFYSQQPKKKRSRTKAGKE